MTLPPPRMDKSYSYTLHDRALAKEIAPAYPYRVRVFCGSKQFATNITLTKRGARRWAKRQVRQHKAGKHYSQIGEKHYSQIGGTIESGILD